MLIAIGILAGAIVPIQTIANTRLSRTTGTALSASLLSFSVGTIALLIITSITGTLPQLHQVLAQPPSTLIGGALGVIALSGNIILYPKLGAIQTVVLPICGQIIAGLLIDSFGLFDAPIIPPNFLRILGAAVVLIGVIACVWRPNTTSAKHHLPLQLAGIGFGMCLAAQSAINGQLGRSLGSALSAALVSFVVGTATLTLVNCYPRWRPNLWITRPLGPWWMWIGGICGASFVSVNALLAPQIGTGLTVMAALGGMMAASVVVDWVRGARVTGMQVLGLLLLAAGVSLLTFGKS
ncbi:DMT family transporter [Corynebacterium pelargi]|uniref:Uncharacterized protein n=1 Tax=Corynebacterium pelargi TaxID=1471400 RepID=A0A410W7E6_9CORY|nr:DMT family transporter [Corynebacterium pelargi]QAU51816.1 hypothetical protein CPELA_02655 [Corynebacterium pelargi]GGG72293.1 hypothetical protein GCM10007338_06690 [Corynebacterium pelargi]